MPRGGLGLGRGRNVSGGSSFLPSDVTQLQQWFRGDSNITLGTGVSQWGDLSGNARHATQATGSQQPTVAAASVGGQDALRFTAASLQYFDIPNFLTGYTSGEVFLVAKLAADPAAASSSSGLWLYGPSAQDAHYPFTDGIIYENFGSTVRKSTGNPSASLTSAHLYNVSTASGAFTTRINGTQHFNTGTNSVLWNSTPRLGRSLNAIYLDGWIAEFIFYNKVLSGTERDNVESYVATRYGISVA